MFYFTNCCSDIRQGNQSLATMNDNSGIESK